MNFFAHRRLTLTYSLCIICGAPKQLEAVLHPPRPPGRAQNDFVDWNLNCLNLRKLTIAQSTAMILESKFLADFERRVVCRRFTRLLFVVSALLSFILHFLSCITLFSGFFFSFSKLDAAADLDMGFGWMACLFQRSRRDMNVVSRSNLEWSKRVLQQGCLSQ